MKTVLVCNQKGGCGKTTVAEGLAWRFQEEKIPFAYYDLDRQGGSYFSGHKDSDAVVGIVDTPGSLQKNLNEWMREADFIIIPTLCSIRDKEPLERMIEAVQQSARNKQVLFVFNRWDRYNHYKDFTHWFETIWPDFDTTILSNSSVIDDAANRQISVTKYRASSQSAKQIQEIYTLVKHGLNLKEGWR